MIRRGASCWPLKQTASVLASGGSVTVEGHIRVNVKEDSRQVRFSAGVVQEGVGFGDRVGEQMVQVGY